MQHKSLLIAARPSWTRDRQVAALQEDGFDVTVADDGIQCLSALRCRAPDAIMIDPDIPWGGGDGVLSILRESPEWRDVRVLVLANGVRGGAIYSMSRYVIYDFVPYPVTPADLVPRVRRLLASAPVHVS